MRRAALLALAVCLALPGAAPAVPSEADCTLKAKPSYRLASVLKRGFALALRCDARATAFAAVEFEGDGEDHIDSEAHPTPEGFSRNLTVEAGRDGTLVVRLEGYARRAAKRSLREHRRFPIAFLIGVERSSGEFHNIPNARSQPSSKLVR
jgi:hypothetical protein